MQEGIDIRGNMHGTRPAEPQIQHWGLGTGLRVCTPAYHVWIA